MKKPEWAKCGDSWLTSKDIEEWQELPVTKAIHKLAESHVEIARQRLENPTMEPHEASFRRGECAGLRGYIENEAFALTKLKLTELQQDAETQENAG